MKYLKKGKYFGVNKKTLDLDGLIITDTVYTYDKVGWHYHENAYFTYILSGILFEGNKKGHYNCGAGTLLLHNWQEPHYNEKLTGYSRGFHIEFAKKWFEHFSLDYHLFEGNLQFVDPVLKALFIKIYNEIKINDASSQISIEGLLLEAFGQIMRLSVQSKRLLPDWAKKVRDVLHEKFSEKLTLGFLSKEVDIHPVYLSREFPKYFTDTIGDYIRKIKIEKSISLMANKNLTLSEISYECGFSDQSHFSRCFRKVKGITPLQFRRIMTKS